VHWHTSGYSLVIALVVAVSAALTAATGSLGFLFAFGLQTLFFWALFVYRKQVTARLVAATTGAAHHVGLPRASAVQRGAAAASAPVTALVGLGRRRSSSDRAQQESALSGSEDTRSHGGENTHSRATAGTTMPRAPSNASPHVGSVDNGQPATRTRGPIAAGEPERLTHGDPLHAGEPDRAQPPLSPASASEARGATDDRALEHDATREPHART